MDEEEEDIEMADVGEDDVAENEESGSDEEVQVRPSDTPTRKNLPTTVTIWKHHKVKKARKQWKENTWTQAYFDITIIEETWIHTGRKGHLILKNRL
jgi:hypothetical protein